MYWKIVFLCLVLPNYVFAQTLEFSPSIQYAPAIAYLGNQNLSEVTGLRLKLGLEWKKNKHGIMLAIGFYESAFVHNQRKLISSKITFGVGYKYYTYQSPHWLWSLNGQLATSGSKIYEDTGILVAPGVIENEFEMLASAGTEIRYRVAFFSLGLGTDVVISMAKKYPSQPNPAMLVPYMSLNLQLK